MELVRRIRVSGRVQGVGFRWFLAQVARERGLRGWVRNELNGDVVCEVGGPSSLLDEFNRLAGIGPAGSQVLAVKSEDAEAADVSDLPLRFTIARL